MAETGLTYTVYDADHMTQAEIYGAVLTRLGGERPDIVALTADLAKSTKIGKFGEKYPERFFNVGIAEQNLFGVGAGLALAGFTPFISTFAVFTSLRAAEQVRTDICYQKLNCKIIATHSGVSFGQAGTTHHCTEDISVMRSFAGMTVIVPADGIETAKAVAACCDWEGPVYIRIGRGFEPRCYENDQYDFQIGKSIQMADGSDLTVIACGPSVQHAVEAAKVLKAEAGLSVRVLNMHTIKPIDKDAIISAVHDTRRIITAEDHSTIGGLGTSVAEVIAETGKSCLLRKLGIPDQFAIVGYPDDLYNHYKIDADGIIEAANAIMGTELEADEDWEDEF
ncbi:MAG TPA: transketolase C-terminal domain-containing protein [Candidatus Brocadiia bacterium]|nr:transketolase C-terminal domain-containing protein [Candidatus Brocadiia bacterium]